MVTFVYHVNTGNRVNSWKPGLQQLAPVNIVLNGDSGWNVNSVKLWLAGSLQRKKREVVFFGKDGDSGWVVTTVVWFFRRGH